MSHSLCSMITFLFEYAYEHLMFSMFRRKREPLSVLLMVLFPSSMSACFPFSYGGQLPVIFFLNEIKCLHINPGNLLIKESQLAAGINHSSWRKSPSLAL